MHPSSSRTLNTSAGQAELVASTGGLIDLQDRDEIILLPTPQSAEAAGIPINSHRLSPLAILHWTDQQGREKWQY